MPQNLRGGANVPRPPPCIRPWESDHTYFEVFISPAPLIFFGNFFHFSATLLKRIFLQTSVLHLVINIFNASEDCPVQKILGVDAQTLLIWIQKYIFISVVKCSRDLTKDKFSFTSSCCTLKSMFKVVC